jgi:hypothetical protein
MKTHAAKAINISYLSISEDPITDEIQAPQAGFIDRSGVFLIRDNAHFSFHVSETFAPHFTLVKGLIEFNRPKDLLFTYDRVDKRIEIKIIRQQLESLAQFLHSVNEWLTQELRFKTQLKVVLDFEDRYRKERDLIYNGLNHSIRGSVKSSE